MHNSLDAELTALLYRLSPASLRTLMYAVARYLRTANASRIRSQVNADGTAYAPRRNGGSRRMLLGYARRIRERVEANQAVVGIFGRMGRFGAVHDRGLNERGIRYTPRNILRLPENDKRAVLDMARAHLAGGLS